MVRKVMCGYEFKRAAGVVTRKSARWIADAGRSEAKREVSVALAQTPGPHVSRNRVSTRGVDKLATMG